MKVYMVYGLSGEKGTNLMGAFDGLESALRFAKDYNIPEGEGVAAWMMDCTYKLEYTRGNTGLRKEAK